MNMLIQNKRNLIVAWIGVVVVAVLAYGTAADYLFPDSVYLLALIGLIVAAMIVKTPILGLYLLILISPFKNQGEEILLLAKLVGLWIAAVLFLTKIFNSESIKFSGLERPIIIMLGGMSISFFRTDEFTYVANNLLSMVSLFGLLLVILNILRNEAKLKRFIWVFFLSSMVPLIFAYRQAMDTNQEITYLRSYGTFPLPTGLGGFLLPILVLAFALIFYQGLTRTERWFVLGIFGAGMVGLILTFSRGAIIGCFVGMIVVFAYIRRQRTGRQFSLVLVVILVVIPMGLFWTSFQGRVVNPMLEFLSGGDGGVNLDQRYDELSVIIPVMLDNKFMGTGLGNYDEAALRYRQEFNLPDLPTYPHNIFMYFLGEVGIFAAFGFFGLIILLILAIIRSSSDMQIAPRDLYYYVYLGSVGSLVGYISFVVTHSAFFTNEIWVMIALLLTTVQHQNSMQTLDEYADVTHQPGLGPGMSFEA